MCMGTVRMSVQTADKPLFLAKIHIHNPYASFSKDIHLLLSFDHQTKEKVGLREEDT